MSEADSSLGRGRAVGGPLGLLVAAGETLALTVAAGRALRRATDLWDEAIDQSVFVLRRCLLPLAISATALGFGAPGLQAGNFLNLLGTIDRLGAFFVPISVREIAPFLTGMIVAGVAGTAICADLGSREVRGELEALRVMGVDPVATLVAPRFLALGLMTPFLLMFAIVATALGGYLAAVVVLGGTSAGFFTTFAANLTLPDLWGAVAKTLVFGYLAASTACYLGMSVSGGPAGVGRAVNRMVVVAFVLIWLINYVATSVVLGGFPGTQVLR
jgi:phospholipid/cholesterol/gamma-HCH transport system permease protein